jgi:hypothetical protein
MVDRIRPYKFESVATGGSQEDEFPTTADPNEDGVDTRRLYLQDDSTDDELVYLDRVAGDLKLFDEVNPAGKTLSALAAGGFDFNDVVWDNPGGIVYAASGDAVVVS